MSTRVRPGFLYNSRLMNQELTLAFIGGGNMASALAAGLMGKRCAAHNVHVVDIDPNALARWKELGATTASQPDETLSARRVWVLAVKPQVMKETIAQCRPYLKEDTLVISVAAGLPSDTLGEWLGSPGAPWTRLIRCMPNTPALIGQGAAGLVPSSGASDEDKGVAQLLLKSVGEVVWVDDDQQLDAVTAVSGSGPAYVFLFLEALIEHGCRLGLTDEQSRRLALATLSGATELAALSPESPAVLRDRVTSKGGTTAAALAVFERYKFKSVVGEAMQACYDRAGELAKELTQ